MTLAAVIRRMELTAVPHDFRSTFREWRAERTNYPGDVAHSPGTTALYFVVGNAWFRP